MPQNRLNNIRLPFLVPKRGKGHVEVLGEVFISCSSRVDPRELLPTIMKMGGETLNAAALVAFLTQVAPKLDILPGSAEGCSLAVSFPLPMLRLSPSLSHTVHIVLPCSLSTDIRGGRTTTSVEVPVRILNSIAVRGTARCSVTSWQEVFVEDIFDYVLAVGKTVLYPATTVQEEMLLSNVLPPGEPPVELASQIAMKLQIKYPSTTGKVVVGFSDFYGVYDIEYEHTW